MTTDMSIDREKLLDNFPLGESELDRLLSLYNNNKDDDNNNGVGIEDDLWLSQVLPHVTSNFFCIEAPRMVSPLIPYDVNESSPMYNIFYYLEAVVSLLGRRGSRFFIHFVYDTVSNNNNNDKIDSGDNCKQVDNDQASVKTANAEELIDFVYRHIQAALFLMDGSTGSSSCTVDGRISKTFQKAWVSSLIKAAGSTSNSNDVNITREIWTNFVNNTLPEAMRGLSTAYHYILLSSSHPFEGASPPCFSLPQPDKESAFWKHNSDPIPISLGSISKSLGGNWYRLHCSVFDGLSFLSFQKALLGYAGPTMILIRKKGKGEGVFGFYTDCHWRESNTWFGGEGFDSFLFKVDKDLSVYWPTYEANSQYMFLNTSSPSIANRNSNTLRGLAIGGIDAHTPRVHLTTSFEKCRAISTDTSYTSGALIDPDDDENGIVSPYFDVDIVEVWAVNVARKTEFVKNVEDGQKILSSKETARQRAAHVDRKQFLDDFKTGTVFNKLFGHREEARGRHDFVAASKAGSGYFVESKPPSKRLLQQESSASGLDDDDDMSGNPF